MERLLVGLGNPGSRYRSTRHNVGFDVVARFAARHDVNLDEERYGGRFGRGRFADLEIGVLQPMTFMNRSGDAVRAAVDCLELSSSDVLVVFDDLDLPFGNLRLRPRGSAGGHNGLADILDQLGTGEVPRLRFGIGRPPEDQGALEYVLAGFDVDEIAALPARIDAAVDAIERALGEGVTEAMNRVNRVTRPEEAESR